MNIQKKLHTFFLFFLFLKAVCISITHSCIAAGEMYIDIQSAIYFDKDNRCIIYKATTTTDKKIIIKFLENKNLYTGERNSPDGKTQKINPSIAKYYFKKFENMYNN